MQSAGFYFFRTSLRVQRGSIFDFPDDLLRDDNKHIAGQRDGRSAAKYDIDSQYNNRQYVHKPSCIFLFFTVFYQSRNALSTNSAKSYPFLNRGRGMIESGKKEIDYEMERTRF